jgi:hypothetical protein
VLSWCAFVSTETTPSRTPVVYSSMISIYSLSLEPDPASLSFPGPAVVATHIADFESRILRCFSIESHCAKKASNASEIARHTQLQ